MSRERPLILAVDDEPATLVLLHKLLTGEGYDVVEAVDGESTLRAIADHQPDLVCLDVMMPAPGGIEVCERVRRDPEHASLPILLLTALDRPEDKVRGLEAGANDFLSKPFDLSELSARLRSLLRTKALQDRLADLLGRYVSANVATEVLRSPFSVSLGGELCEVSTLFADVRGYTALAAEHPPETILDLLNRYLTVATDAVERHDGTVADLLGDGIGHDRQVPVQQVQDGLRRMLRRECRVAAHVREQRGHLAPIAAQRDGERSTQHLRSDTRADVASQQVGEPILQRLRPQQ